MGGALQGGQAKAPFGGQGGKQLLRGLAAVYDAQQLCGLVQPLCQCCLRQRAEVVQAYPAERRVLGSRVGAKLPQGDAGGKLCKQGLQGGLGGGA